ncbi:ribonuclease T2 family protein [Altererythrobacter sp. C41]|uniref:ribonuclease T2 family protein n=1 Tax=Altererythrobacter sp. C41 TaxID=2806021 RepID=UPI0030834FF4
MNSRRAAAAVGAGFLIAAIAVPAHGQAYQCQVPRSVWVPEVAREGPARQVPVRGYTLALSWSPEFCKGREGRAAQRMQCSGRNGRFGFVVHGLWPEGHKTWPQWCQTARRASPAEVRRNLCMMPSASLAARQWVKHGSCMVARPETYFKVTRILWNSLRFPDMDRLSRREGLTAGTIREHFLLANRGWRADAVGVHLDGRGWLEELRLCYGKDFRPAKCDARRYGAKDGTRVKVWRGL